MNNILEIGFEGEKVIRDYLKRLKDCEFGQIDVMAKIKDKWYSLEIKKQDIFEPPPFYGHGLPPWQVRFRIKMYKELGVIPLLFVVDKKSNIVYYQDLRKLFAGEIHETKTGNRLIFPIDGFKILK